MTALLWLGLAVVPTETDPERLRAALRQLQQQVRTLTCDIEAKASSVTGRCRFAMDGAIIRMSEQWPYRAGELWTDGHIVKTITTLKSTGQVISRIDRATNDLGGSDARLLALWHVNLWIWGPNGPKAMPKGRRGVAVADLLQPPNGMKAPRYIAAERIVRLEISCPYQCDNWTIDLDEDRNWQPRRLINHKCNPPPMSHRRDMRSWTIAEFTEAAGGIYFPVKVEVRATVGDLVLGDPVTGIESTWNISNIKINEPVAPEKLAFHFPPHSEVGDMLQETIMVTDANGDITGPAFHPDGQVKRIRRSPPPQPVLPGKTPEAAQVSPAQPAFTTQTANMPPPASFPWGWAAGGSSAIALGLLVWWYRRR